MDWIERIIQKLQTLNATAATDNEVGFYSELLHHYSHFLDNFWTLYLASMERVNKALELGTKKKGNSVT